jgi:hypothetical protein
MQIESLKGTIGGGQVSATGGAQLSGLSISQFLLNVRGDKITLDYPADFRSTVNLNLELRGSLEAQGRQFVRGNVEVIRTEYTKDINLAELINQRGPGSIEEGSEFKFAETANFDKLRVEGRNALIMRNNLGNLVGSISFATRWPGEESDCRRAHYGDARHFEFQKQSVRDNSWPDLPARALWRRSGTEH